MSQPAAGPSRFTTSSRCTTTRRSTRSFTEPPNPEKPMSSPSEKILVTGGAGFIASHLCEALLADGAEIVVIDDFNDFYDPAIKRGNIAGFRDQITLVKGDIRDVELVDSLFAAARFDKVFHFAAR